MTFRRLTGPLSLACLALSLIAGRTAQALPEHNVARAVSTAIDLGRVPADQPATLTVFLKLHDQAGYDRAVAALYDPSSPTYEHWFTDNDFARYAPTAEEFDTVKRELLSSGFNIVAEDPGRLSIRVRGTEGQVERAFQTEIHTFDLGGRTADLHIRDAQLTGRAGDLVDAVAGLERHQARPTLALQLDPRTGKPRAATRLTQDEASGALLNELTDLSLSPVETFNLTTPGSALPTAQFTGMVYDKDPTKTVAFTPTQLSYYYGLADLYTQGYDGRGQTIALVEGYGYPVADEMTDGNTAAKLFGLPQLTASNFAEIFPDGPPFSAAAGALKGWTSETALDIQAAHALAPGAKIVVVAAAADDGEDLLSAMKYVIDHRLASVVSDSWTGGPEFESGPAECDAFNAVLERAAAVGISFQFSSGDRGDHYTRHPYGGVAVPMDSPWDTAVGGTSILSDPATGEHFATGWGQNQNYLYAYQVSDPLNGQGFYYGAGGGPSGYFAKPAWQSALVGTTRQTPDVAALADPSTGFPFLYTLRGKQWVVKNGGGTSLASPLFTAMWAICDQYNGAALGFAAPRIAALKRHQITDVEPNTGLEAGNVKGSITDSNGTTKYDARQIFAGLLYKQYDFLSAVWPESNDLVLAISFGTDSSLKVGKGWDDVTGFGEPNGLPFIQGVTGKTTGAPVK